ncbi:MAG: hypothetical protein JKY54_16900 [Flavobacteriales bacterium]|nr:hypothetical protein [Flavobacteriales bacterium]
MKNYVLYLLLLFLNFSCSEAIQENHDMTSGPDAITEQDYEMNNSQLEIEQYELLKTEFVAHLDEVMEGLSKEGLIDIGLSKSDFSELINLLLQHDLSNFKGRLHPRTLDYTGSVRVLGSAYAYGLIAHYNGQGDRGKWRAVRSGIIKMTEKGIIEFDQQLKDHIATVDMNTSAMSQEEIYKMLSRNKPGN